MPSQRRQRAAHIYDQPWRRSEPEPTSADAPNLPGSSSQPTSRGSSSTVATASNAAVPVPPTTIPPALSNLDHFAYILRSLSPAVAPQNAPRASRAQDSHHLSPNLLPSLSSDLASNSSSSRDTNVSTLAYSSSLPFSSQALGHPRPSGYAQPGQNTQQTTALQPAPSFPPEPSNQVQTPVQSIPTQPAPSLPLGHPSQVQNLGQTGPYQAPPGLPMTIRQPPPIQQGQAIYTTRDTGPGPERLYTLVLLLKSPSTGFDYLFCDNEHKGLFYGHFDGPLAYFTMRPRRDAFAINGFMVGNRRMLGTRAELLFPLFDPAKMERCLPNIEEQAVLGTGTLMVKWPNVLAALIANRRDVSGRDRFAREVAITARMGSSALPCLALYKSVIIKDMIGGARVTGIVYEKYITTLWEFTKVHNLLRAAHLVQIVDSVRRGVEILHERGIVHRQVMAGNVYLKYSIQNDCFIGVLGVEITEVKLGNFEEAQHCITGMEADFIHARHHDHMRLILLKDWLKYTLGMQDTWLVGQENARNSKLQEGILQGKQLEEADKFFKERLSGLMPFLAL